MFTENIDKQCSVNSIKIYKDECNKNLLSGCMKIIIKN